MHAFSLGSLISHSRFPLEPLGSEPYLPDIIFIMSQNLNKPDIRKKLLQQRNSLSFLEIKQASDGITQMILSWEKFKSAQHIGLYHAFLKEVDLHSLWVKANALGKKIYFPVISPANKTMQFLEALPDQELSVNQFNIKEPLPDSKSISMEALDCLFIPLVAFDKKGYRLGMGQGYYDRALVNLNKKPYCVGIAYGFQEADILPHDSWDIPLDAVVTEKQLFLFN